MIHFTVKSFSLPVSEPYKTQAKALGSLCFDRVRLPDDQQEHEDRFCSKRDWYRFVLAIEDDHVIGSITTLIRPILFQGQQILLGGIGGVCTHPDKRREGVAVSTLQAAMAVLTEAQCDLAYLCTDTDAEGVWLYSKVGFVPIGRNHTYLGKSGVRYTDDDGMIAPVCSPKIFRQVLEAPEPFDIGTGNW